MARQVTVKVKDLGSTDANAPEKSRQ